MRIAAAFLAIAVLYLAAFSGVVLLVLILFAAINRFADYGESRGWWTRRSY